WEERLVKEKRKADERRKTKTERIRREDEATLRALEQERREAEQKRQLAEEQRQAELESKDRLADEKRKAEERRNAEAEKRRKTEIERKRRDNEAALRVLEEERRAAEEKERLAKQHRQAELEAKELEERLAEEKAEERRKAEAEEKRKAEIERKRIEGEAALRTLKEERQKAEEKERLAKQQRQAELEMKELEGRLAEEKSRIEERRKTEAEEIRRAEMERKRRENEAALRALEEERREAEENRRLAEEQRQVELEAKELKERLAEEKRKAEERRKAEAEEGRQAEERHQAEIECKRRDSEDQAMLRTLEEERLKYPLRVDLEGVCEDETFEAESVTVWPKKGVVPSISPVLGSDDFVRLQSRWEGGCILSVHDSGLADDWLNHYYEHECLVNLRANKIGGPIPSMLSVDVPALTVFGAMSPEIIEMAGELTKLSGFPVMIRPVTEDPSAHFIYKEPANLSGESTSSQTIGTSDGRGESEHGSSHCGTSLGRSNPLGHDEYPDKLAEGGDDDDDDGHSPDPPASATDLRQREITHDTDICLGILVNGNDREDFLHLQTSVKFYPIPNEKEPPDSGKSKPKIEAHIVHLKLLRSPSVEIDSATGSLGFLTGHKSFLHFSNFVSLGHDESPRKYTFIENEQRTKTSNVTAGLAGGKPTLTGGLTYAKVDATTTQAAEDTPSSYWVVKFEAMKQSSNYYRTLNTKIYRSHRLRKSSSSYQDMDLDAKYGMSVEVDLPIRKDAPKVSFIYRHQIHCWVAVKSKARCRGIIVVAANYIPDIYTERPLRIREYPKLNLVLNGSEENIEGDASPRPEQTSAGIISFGTAIIPEAPHQILQRLRSFKQRIKRRLKKPHEQIMPDIPIHTHVRRGWDHTNLQWQSVVWPKLDCDLQPLQGRSTAAWRLDGRGGWNAKDAI
ncbi:hypothetical protein PILCRDRAFT_4817, partial [Piloderma croceum F 1598]